MKLRTSTTVFSSILVLLLAGSPRQLAGSEVVPQPDETLPGLKFEKLFDMTGFDRVNVFSGDVQLTIPLGPSYPVTAGFSYQLAAHYSSKIWHMELLECAEIINECQVNKLAGRARLLGLPALGVGWALGVERIEAVTNASGITSWILVEADGSRRQVGWGTLPAVSDDGLRLRQVSGGFELDRPDGSVWTFTHWYQRPATLTNGSDFFASGLRETVWNVGLKRVKDRFGNADVMTVDYEAGGDWRVRQINLTGGRAITFYWTSYGDWPVLSSVGFPATGGKTLMAEFSRTGPGFTRPSFDENETYDPGCGRPSAPSLVGVPLLQSITFKDGGTTLDTAWGFEYATGSEQPGGVLKRVTLPTGGKVDYQYSSFTAVPPRIRDVYGEPETVDLFPAQQAEDVNPICNAVWKFQAFFEGSAAVISRSELDRGDTAISTVTYKRVQVAERQDRDPGGPPKNLPDPDRVVRVVVVNEPDGNKDSLGNPVMKSRRHVFYRESGQEISRRVYAGANGNGSPVRSWITCYGYDGAGPCGVMVDVQTSPTEWVEKITEGVGPWVPVRKNVTWYGANPEGEGADCSEATDSLCWQKEASSWDGVAREYEVWTTVRAACSSVSAPLFPTDFLRRVETTQYSPDTSRWDLKRVTFSGTTDVYAISGDGCSGTPTEGCKPENAPCETGTSYEYAETNGFLTKATRGDVPGTQWKLVTAFTEGTSPGTIATETHTSLPASDTYSISRTYQHGRVLTATWTGMTWKRFDVDRDANTGLVTASRDTDGVHTSYGYDALGRLTSMTPPGEAAFAYCYRMSQTDNSFVLAKRGSCSLTNLSEAPATTGSGRAAYEVYHYDGMGRLARKIRRMPSSQTTGGSYFSFQQTSYASNGEVSFSSEWAPCGLGGYTADNPSGCFGSTTSTGRFFSNFDPFNRALKESWPLATGGFETVRKYDLDGSGNDLKMGEWRQTGSSTASGYSRRLELRSVLGVPLAVMEDENLVAPLDASLTGAISFLYWNVLGKLSRSQDDGRAEDGPAPSMVLPSTPEPVPTQARAWIWDRSGLLLAESHPEISGAITNTAFDGLGNVTSQNEAGTLHTFVYDRAGRLTSHTGSDGTYVSNAYDATTGRLTFRRSAAPASPVPYPLAGLANTYTLFADQDFLYSNGKLIRRGLLFRDGTNGEREAGPGRFDIAWTHGSYGEVTSETRTAPGLSPYTVNLSWKSGLVASALDSGGAGVSGSAYAPSGLMTKMSQVNGVTVENILDANNVPRPATIKATRGKTTLLQRAYTYDGAGNITSNGVDSFTYDGLSRLLTSGPGTGSETFEYDRFGNMTNRTDASIGVDAETNRLTGTDVTYDNRGNLTRKGADGFAYDSLGRSTGYETWSWNPNSGRYESRREWTHIHDGADERVLKIHEEDGTPVSRRSMARWLVQAKEQTPATGCVAGQERFEDVPCSDADWGWIEQMAVLGITLGYSPEPPSTRNTYKPERLVERQEMAAFLTRAGYGGDAAVTDPGGPVPDWTDVAPQSIFRRYINRLYKDGVTSGCSGTPGVNSFCPADTVTEKAMRAFVARGGLIDQPAPLSRKYWPGVGILPPSSEVAIRDGQNRVVMEYRESSRTAARQNLYFGNVLSMSKLGAVAEYYVNDHLGSPRVVTNGSGTIVETREYRSFGEQVTGSTSQKLGFAQMELDYESGSHNDHARNYRAAFARFLSPDQLQGTPTDPQSWNRYTYARNNPLRFVDPDGRQAAQAIAAAPAVSLLPTLGIASAPPPLVIGGALAALGGFAAGRGIAEYFAHSPSLIPVVLAPQFLLSRRSAADKALDAGFAPGAKAPDQVTPGISEVDGVYDPADRSEPEPYRAHYDQYGRQVGRTDYTDQPDPSTHTNPHHTTREYGPGYGPKGKESRHPGPHPADTGMQPPQERVYRNPDLRKP
ncbi:MAG: hypothetical protein IT186_15110 [Acidobacteria bacterium]|nr:hypothetical protein [Acidobacteriota bacterium]